MTVGLNRLDKQYLYQILEQMDKEQTDTLTLKREDVLMEIGSRTYNEHEGDKVTKPNVAFADRKFKCDLCEYASISAKGLGIHRAKHPRGSAKGPATVGEFAGASGGEKEGLDDDE